MKERFEKLVQTVQEMQIVEMLMTAGSTDGQVKICQRVAETPEFKEFLHLYDKFFTDGCGQVDYLFSSDDFTCTAQNAVAVAVVCIIEGINVQDMFDIEGYELFITALEEVDGPQKITAETLVCFFDTYGYWITEFETKELLEAIFNIF